MIKIDRYPLKSTRLVTVNEAVAVADQSQYAGYFVRLRPGDAHVTDGELKHIKKELLAAGALAVRIMPKPPGDHIQLGKSAALVEGMTDEDGVVPPVRDLLAALADASTSKHRPQLKALLEELADEVGQ